MRRPSAHETIVWLRQYIADQEWSTQSLVDDMARFHIALERSVLHRILFAEGHRPYRQTIDKLEAYRRYRAADARSARRRVEARERHAERVLRKELEADRVEA
jgi:hypothetical protein